MTLSTAERIEVAGGESTQRTRVLTREALSFIARLHREFNPTREALLRRRSRTGGWKSPARSIAR